MRSRILSVLIFGAALAVLLAVLLGSPRRKDEPRPDADSSLLLNRVWSERSPRDARDLVLQLALVGRAKFSSGVLARSSRWRVHADVLRFQLEGNRLWLEFPQEKRAVSFEVRTYRCSGPASFDLCLELRRGQKVLLLYGTERRGLEEAPAALRPWLEPLADKLETCDGGCAEALPSWLDEER